LVGQRLLDANVRCTQNQSVVKAKVACLARQSNYYSRLKRDWDSII
jgi:hypothetical protein